MDQVEKDLKQRADPMRGEVERGEEGRQTVVTSVGPRPGAASERQKEVAVGRVPELALLAWGTWWVVQRWRHPTCQKQGHQWWLVEAAEDFLKGLEKKKTLNKTTIQIFMFS